MELVKLGTILHMEKGKKPLHQIEGFEDGYVPYVDIKAFEQGIISSYATAEKAVTCNEGDLLIVCDGSRSGLTGKAINGVVGSTLSKIWADGLTTDYLRYFIQSQYTFLNTKKKGTGTPHLNANLLKEAKLVVPPIEDQKRIVAKIDELFSNLDASVSELKSAKEKLKVYRQAVLKEAFENIESHIILGQVLISKPRNGYSPKGVSYETPYKNLTLTATTSGIFQDGYYKFVDIDIRYF